MWDPTSITKWRSLDFCLLVWWFNVPTIKHVQLTTLSQAQTWANAEKPRKDMAFLLLAPSLAARGERVFGLVAMWAHPHQVCLVSLAEVAWCLVLLADKGPDWPYAFISMNNTVLHVLLSSKGHLSILMEGKPQREPLWLPPPVASMETTTMWGAGGLPRRTECWAWCHSLWLHRAATLEMWLPQVEPPKTPPWLRWTYAVCPLRLLAPPQHHPVFPTGATWPTVTEILNLHMQEGGTWCAPGSIASFQPLWPQKCHPQTSSKILEGTQLCWWPCSQNPPWRGQPQWGWLETP